MIYNNLSKIFTKRFDSRSTQTLKENKKKITKNDIRTNGVCFHKEKKRSISMLLAFVVTTYMFLHAINIVLGPKNEKYLGFVQEISTKFWVMMKKWEDC